MQTVGTKRRTKRRIGKVRLRDTKRRRHNYAQERGSVPRSDSESCTDTYTETGDDGNGKDNDSPSYSSSEGGDDGDGKDNAPPQPFPARRTGDRNIK